MAMVTAQKLLECLERGTGQMELPEDPDRANAPLERMLELAAR